MPNENAIIAVYNRHTEAEEAVQQLERAGFNMKKLSVVGKDHHSEEHVVGYYNAGDRMRYWGKRGAFWGGMWSTLSGAACFAVPTIGPVLVAGPLVGWIVAGLEGTPVKGELSAIGAGLHSVGIPKDSVLRFEVALKADKLLLMAHGAAGEVGRAKEIIAGTHPAELGVHGEKLQPAGMA